MALAGTGGVGLGSIRHWVCSMIMAFDTIGPESAARPIGVITLQVKLTEKA